MPGPIERKLRYLVDFPGCAFKLDRAERFGSRILCSVPSCPMLRERCWGLFWDKAMRMQRIIASLLLSVFILTPLAPAALAPTQPVAQHCVRQPSTKTDAAMSGMHCHEAATHTHRSMAAMPSVERT